MRVTITDFYYRGRHFDEFTCELPQFNGVEYPSDEELTKYVTKCLEKFIDAEEGSN